MPKVLLKAPGIIIYLFVWCVSFPETCRATSVDGQHPFVGHWDLKMVVRGANQAWFLRDAEFDTRLSEFSLQLAITYEDDHYVFVYGGRKREDAKFSGRAHNDRELRFVFVTRYAPANISGIHIGASIVHNEYYLKLVDPYQVTGQWVEVTASTGASNGFKKWGTLSGIRYNLKKPEPGGHLPDVVPNSSDTPNNNANGETPANRRASCLLNCTKAEMSCSRTNRVFDGHIDCALQAEACRASCSK